MRSRFEDEDTAPKRARAWEVYPINSPNEPFAWFRFREDAVHYVSRPENLRTSYREVSA